MSEERTYLPAAGHDWALPLYDPIVRLFGFEAVKRRLLAAAMTGRPHRVLDIGCGTGTLAIRLKKLHPEVEVVGLDPDAKALARSRDKASRAGLSIRFDQGFSQELPYPDASFDCVLSSLMFHHLPADMQEKTLQEARRILTPGGSLYLLDMARGDKAGGDLLNRISGHLQGNSDFRILDLMRRAGFASPVRTIEQSMLLGTLRVACYRGEAPTV